VTRAETAEAAIIAIVFAAGWWARPYLPSALTLAQATLALSALLLAQGLIRDIAILLRNRRTISPIARREAQCMCLESTLGILGVVVGATLVGLSLFERTTISGSGLWIAGAMTLTLGFLIKDFVVSWKPWGLRREPDHLNVIVRWRR
jgi:hypothetical protein